MDADTTYRRKKNMAQIVRIILYFYNGTEAMNAGVYNILLILTPSMLIEYDR